MSGKQIHAYLRRPSADREDEQVGPFVARFTPGSRHPMLNYAVPNDDADPSPREIEALVQAFRQRGRKPRLEYAADGAPALEGALVAAGFEVEARLPLMACHPADARPIHPPSDFAVLRAETAVDHADAIVVADEAYGELATVPGPAAIASRQAMSAAGGAVVLARERVTRMAAGSGLFPPPCDGVTELAAVGTRGAFRRRGVATAVTSLLAECASASGVDLLWLTPEHNDSERIYARVGFARLDTTMIHISRRTE